MVVQLTPKPTRTTEALVRTPATIVSSREEDAALKEVAFRCLLLIDKARAKEKTYI
jgi:hypothetical protein